MKEKKQPKPKKKPGKVAIFSALSILIFIVGVATSVLAAKLPFFQEEGNIALRNIVIYVGLAIIGVGIVCIIIAVAINRYYDTHPQLHSALEQVVYDAQAADPTALPVPDANNAPEAIPDAVAHLDNNASSAGSNVTYVGTNVTYIPSMEAYEFINMGRYQTVDEKFDQIGKMDHTQFVIYIARLFARKGYQVKLTPVVDNYEIDIIVEKMGVTIAVGCLLTNKVLCKEDIVCVRKGQDHYNVNNCMALTNMYFDRTALEYARQERMSLVDRNILAEDFMN